MNLWLDCLDFDQHPILGGGPGTRSFVSNLDCSLPLAIKACLFAVESMVLSVTRSAFTSAAYIQNVFTSIYGLLKFLVLQTRQPQTNYIFGLPQELQHRIYANLMSNDGYRCEGVGRTGSNFIPFYEYTPQSFFHGISNLYHKASPAISQEFLGLCVTAGHALVSIRLESIEYEVMSASILRDFRQCPNVEVFELGASICALDDEALKEVVISFPKLRSLDISVGYRDTTLSFVGNHLQHLESLTLQTKPLLCVAENASSEAIASLIRKVGPRLKKLSITGKDQYNIFDKTIWQSIEVHCDSLEQLLVTGIVSLHQSEYPVDSTTDHLTPSKEFSLKEFRKSISSQVHPFAAAVCAIDSIRELSLAFANDEEWPVQQQQDKLVTCAMIASKGSRLRVLEIDFGYPAFALEAECITNHINRNCSRLEKLTLRHLEIGVEAIRPCLVLHNSLQELTLGQCDGELDKEVAVLLATGFPHLTRLTLEDMTVKPCGLDIILQSRKDALLSIAMLNCGPSQSICAQKILATCACLTSLTLSDQELNGDLCSAFSSSKSAKTLTDIGLVSRSSAELPSLMRLVTDLRALKHVRVEVHEYSNLGEYGDKKFYPILFHGACEISVSLFEDEPMRRPRPGIHRSIDGRF